jgi:hypothetical protein
MELTDLHFHGSAKTMEYATGVGCATNPGIPEQHILKYDSRVGKIWKLKIKLRIQRSEKRYKFLIVYCFFLI